MSITECQIIPELSNQIEIQGRVRQVSKDTSLIAIQGAW